MKKILKQAYNALVILLFFIGVGSLAYIMLALAMTITR